MSDDGDGDDAVDETTLVDPSLSEETSFDEAAIDIDGAEAAIRAIARASDGLESATSLLRDSSLPSDAFGQLRQSRDLHRRYEEWLVGATQELEAAAIEIETFVEVDAPRVLSEYRQTDETAAQVLGNTVGDAQT